MLNEIVAVVVSPFARKGKEADKNGLTNVYLTAVAGKIPNQAQVISGTVAEKAGLVIGKTLLVMIDEKPAVMYEGVLTRQFNHTVLGEVKPSEILGLRKELGNPLPIDTRTVVDNAEGTEGASPVLNVNTSTLPAENAAATVEG